MSWHDSSRKAPEMITAEPDFTTASWCKSSHSTENNGECVEVAFVPRWVGVRDTKQLGHGPVLAFAAAEWDAFLAGARDGEFTRPGR